MSQDKDVQLQNSIRIKCRTWNKKAKKNINWREAVHDALDIAGSITGYGDICDAVNAVLYLTEGDYINAGLSALSIIPRSRCLYKDR